MRPFSLLASVAMFAALLAPALARADDEAGAHAAMSRGIAASGRGDAAEALAAYEEAKTLAPGANVPYLYAAEALVRLERYEDAVRNLEQYLSMSPDVSDAGEVKARIEKIRRDHFPGKIHVSSSVPGAHLTIDGVTRSEVTPADLTLPPGKHALLVTSDGYEPETLEITVIGDTTADAPVALTPVPPKSELSPDDHIVKPSPSIVRTAGFVTLGAAAVALGTAVILDVTALKQKTDDFTAAENAGSPSAVGLQDDVRSLRSGVVVTYIGGGVLAAAGAAMILLAPRGEAARTGVRAHLTPEVGPRGCGWSLAGTF